MEGSSPLLVLAFCASCIFGHLIELVQAQNQSQATTDPAEGVPLSLPLSNTVSYLTYYLFLAECFVLFGYIRRNYFF